VPIFVGMAERRLKKSGKDLRERKKSYKRSLCTVRDEREKEMEGQDGAIESRQSKRARRISNGSAENEIVDLNDAMESRNALDENYLGGIITCRNCNKPLFGGSVGTRLRLSLDQLTACPNFAQCPDWSRQILFREYQVESRLSVLRVVPTKLFSLCFAEGLFRGMAFLDFLQSYSRPVYSTSLCLVIHDDFAQVQHVPCRKHGAQPVPGDNDDSFPI
jgi:hypothetical protein